MKFKVTGSIRLGSLTVIQRVAVFTVLLLLSSQILYAQTTEQIWFEYSPTHSFPENYKLGIRASYRTNLTDPRWRTAELRLMPEKKLNRHFDVLASLQILDTRQTHQLTTMEIRPAVGGRWHFLPGKRISSGLMARVEFRNVYNKEAQEWTYTTRGRLRIFASMPLNEKSMEPDRVFYATTFLEFFSPNDEDIQERFANRLWFRLGLGYKFNKKLKFELLFNRQDSKNTITDNYQDLTKENIILFALKHKLN